VNQYLLIIDHVQVVTGAFLVLHSIVEQPMYISNGVGIKRCWTDRYMHVVVEHNEQILAQIAQQVYTRHCK
jgi:hypothetical protein